MSETIVRTADPYQPLFERIENSPACSTVEAYEEYVQYIDQNDYDPCIYLSMAITSGGFARDERLPFAEMLAKNTAHGQLLADVTVQQYGSLGITKSDIVVPATLGKVAGWGQADYLLFWAHVITGVTPTQAKAIDAGVRDAGVIGLPGFADKRRSKQTRWLDYKQLIDTYVDQLDQLPTPIHPKNMQAVIVALDAEESLGVNAERYLCHQLGLGEYTFGVEPSLGIAADLGVVRRLGASTLPDGFPDIAGRHDINTALRRRAAGQYFRKSGIVAGIVDRREPKPASPFDTLPGKPPATLWADYYAH